MEQVIKTISEWVWSPALVVICLMAGLYFSIGTRFVQVRRFREMARLLFANDKSRNTGVTSFQAFSMALSGRVGGVKRGIYSNEAGQGTGAIVAGAAEVSHPVKQGLVQAFSVYVDTLLVCTATAVMILACNTYNVFDASGNILIAAQGVQLGEPEVEYTTAAIGTLLGMEWGGIIISIAMFFFAFTTLMAYYYYAETNLVYLFGKGKMERVLIWLLRVGLVTMVFVGSLYEASVIWAIGDTGVGAMAWINVIAILLLSPKAFKALKSYERQKKEGKEPVFNPEEIGVKEAVYWDKYNYENLS